MTENQLYQTPILNSWGVVTLVNYCGLITPERRTTVVFLGEGNKPIRPEDVAENPGLAKSCVVVTRRTGDPRPTEADRKSCDAWHKALAGTNLMLSDYIIICGGSHYSFANERVEGPGPKGF